MVVRILFSLHTRFFRYFGERGDRTVTGYDRAWLARFPGASAIRSDGDLVKRSSNHRRGAEYVMFSGEQRRAEAYLLFRRSPLLGSP